MSHDFEKQLATTPRRTAPPEWRENILATARARSRRTSEAAATRTHVLGWLRSWLGGISPAWRGLAAVWGVCIVVNHFAASTLTVRGVPDGVAPEQVAAARAQRAELLRLAGLAEPEPAEPPPTRPPGPRTNLRRPARPSYG